MTTLRFGNRTLFVADDSTHATVRLANRAAKSSVPVLICGESGTGKEVMARFIHEKSERSKHRFVSVNCAAIPDGLLEAELFGYEKGAFTGATTSRMGKFELAHRGTLLLDEISEMPILLQAKLLRVLQEGEVDRLGGLQPIPIETRIIATTNRDPLDLIDSGLFREDLFYRLNVIRIDCKPLRARKEGILQMAGHMAQEIGSQLGKPTPSFSAAAMQKLQRYSWPGNVRELQNVLQRAILLSEGETIECEHLSAMEERRSTQRKNGEVETLFEVEKRHILEALQQTSGNRARAARLLGISVRTLRNKLKIYNSL